MKVNESKILDEEVIILNIFRRNDKDALVKVLSRTNLFFVLAKGFYGQQSKNRSNMMIGSIVKISFFEKYSHQKQFLLKKASVIWHYDLSKEIYSAASMKLFFIFQLLTGKNTLFFDNYVEMIQTTTLYNCFYLITFLASLSLASEGLKVDFNFCVICKSNKNLFSFSFFEGGMMCKLHHSYKNEKLCFKKIQELKSLYFLGINFEKYCEITSPKFNLEIYDSLINFISHY